MIFAAFVVASVLGLTINDSLTVTPCAANESMQEFLARTEACWKQIGVAGEDEREIFKPMSKPQPHYIRANVLVHMIDDKIVAIEIPTTGVASQTDVIKDLEAKFGKPARQTHDRLQNPMGAQITGLRAWWKTPSYSVFFDSTESDLEYGAIKITTPAYDAAKKARFGPTPHL